MPAETIPHKVLLHGERTPGNPAYYVRESDGWKATSWRTYADEVKTAAKALIALGLEVGPILRRSANTSSVMPRLLSFCSRTRINGTKSTRSATSCRRCATL